MFRISRSRAQRAAVAIACGALSAGAVLATSAAASAAPTTMAVSCSASGQVNFNPGVQMLSSAQQVSYLGQDSQCNDYSNNGILSGKLTANFAGIPLGCLASGGSAVGSGTARIDWTLANGQAADSIISLKLDSTTLNNAQVSGYVTSGSFQGAAFTGTFSTSLVGGGVSCTFGAPLGGVKSASFKGTFNLS